MIMEEVWQRENADFPFKDTASGVDKDQRCGLENLGQKN